MMFFFIFFGKLAWAQKNTNYDPNFTYFTIGTGPASGTYFTVGSTLASSLTRPPGSPPCDRGGSCGVDNVIAIANASQGSKHNLDLLREDKVNSAIIQSNELTDKSTSDIKIIAALFPEYLHAVVGGHSTLHQYSDLKNKKISLGSNGGGSGELVKPLIETLGLSTQDYTLVNQELSQSCDALTDKQIDAFLYFAGGPIPSLSSLAKCQQIRLLSLTSQQQLKLIRKHKYLTPIEIPASLYWGVAKTTTVAVYALWVTLATTPEEEIYKFTQSYFNPKTQKILNETYPNLKILSLAESTKIAGKNLHAGSLKYVKESGK